MSNRTLAFSSAPLSMEPLLTNAEAERRAVSPEHSVLSYLTAGDRDVIAAMFGPYALSTARDVDGKLVGVPEFVVILVEDRQSGRLPAGIEVTSTYLRAVWDNSPSFARPGTVLTPLTKKNLTDGLYFLGRRSHGGAVDVRA